MKFIAPTHRVGAPVRRAEIPSIDFFCLPHGSCVWANHIDRLRQEKTEAAFFNYVFRAAWLRIGKLRLPLAEN
ncbi:hypothetical protein [Variovorax boronicumulans]|uniref:hypothetical protein n=1 Tax=Variovorax boronicumulans TaxID=436515 RepID=UPI001330CAA2|nr:hypothetical protein [Variovorax boronicumulans]